MTLIHMPIIHKIQRPQRRFHTALMTFVSCIITGHGVTQSYVVPYKNAATFFIACELGSDKNIYILIRTTANYLHYLHEFQQQQAGPSSQKRCCSNQQPLTY